MAGGRPPGRVVVDRSQWITMIVVSVVAVGGAAWYAARAPEPPPVTLIHTASVREAGPTVHVSGAVAVPGLVRLPEGARAADAIAAAGGALPGADLGSVNLAAPMADGQHLAVPFAAAPSGAGAPDAGPIAVNSASAAELEALPGVGPVLARRIVEYRERNGPFAGVEDLLEVPGIGEAKLAELREAVRVP